MRVADYIADYFFKNGMRDVFMITGGGAMFLNDAIGKHQGIRYWSNHHEQASSMAAESYARLTGKIAPLCVTSGPGGTNAITGVWGAWVDSIPMFVISGQVRQQNTVMFSNLPLRQYGDQEIDIIKCVKSFTKYAVQVRDSSQIRREIEKAHYIAIEGRPGPVWLDIPLDVQNALVNPDSLEGFDSGNFIAAINHGLEHSMVPLLEKMGKAERPVVLLGPAIRSANMKADAMELVNLLGFPIVTAWNAHDLIPYEHPLYIGRQGHPGDRAGNYAVQNSDFLLILGSRMGVRQIGFAWESFARAAYRVMVDIDEAELSKPNFPVDLAVKADLRHFIPYLKQKIVQQGGVNECRNWVNWCLQRKKKYPVVLKEYYNLAEKVNPYCFIEELWKLLPNDAVVVAGNGTACTCSFQGAKIKEGQRLYTNVGCAAMGYDLPAAIGASIGSGGKVYCLAGDGSFQMNIQELQTIVHNGFPIKIFVLNNSGYHSIRQTQKNFFAGNFVGCDEESGVSFPNLNKIAYAYGIDYFCCSNHLDMPNVIFSAITTPNACLCEVILDINQPFAPRMASGQRTDGSLYSRPLEDLAPLLERQEVLSNMLIPLLKFE